MYSPFVLVTPNNWTQLWALLPRLRRRQVAGGVRLLKLSNRPMRITRSTAHSTFASLASLVMRWKEISLYSTNIRDWRFLQICRESLDIYLMDSKKNQLNLFSVMEFFMEFFANGAERVLRRKTHVWVFDKDNVSPGRKTSPQASAWTPALVLAQLPTSTSTWLSFLKFLKLFYFASVCSFYIYIF